MSPPNAESSVKHCAAWQRYGLLLLVLILLVRLLLMLWLPLTDTTEARYAEIARKMLETGDWVTPLHDYGVPFWAKPPLSTWLSALSMGLFGQSEFAVRLPSFLLALATLGLTGSLAFKRFGYGGALAAMLMLASSVMFFVASGTVMTDPTLLFCTTLIIVSFWKSMTEPSRLWPYLFFVGAGLGLLAKGPIALVLSGLPIFFWVLFKWHWLALWQRLPWLKGIVLTLVIAAPWYIWAEIRTPGFLNYFIVGEHIQRFLDSGWEGDKYGFAHATPKGMIWLYAFAALVPWSVVALWWLVRWRKHSNTGARENGWLSYLVLCCVMPLVFFTFSGNIIFPYVLPMMPAACLLLTELWQRTPAGRLSYLPGIACFTLIIGLILLVLQAFMSSELLRTQKLLISQWQKLDPAPNSQLIYWSKRREFSAEFYSNGRARATEDPQVLRDLLSNNAKDYVVIEDKDLPDLPQDLQQTLITLATVEVKGDHMLILAEQDPEPLEPRSEQEVQP